MIGASDAGKSYWARAITLPGRAGETITSETFAWQECLDKDLIVIQEACLATQKEVEEWKQVLEGSSTQINIKCKSGQRLHRTPCLINANKRFWRYFSDEADAFRNRMFGYFNLKPSTVLKRERVVPCPAFFAKTFECLDATWLWTEENLTNFNIESISDLENFWRQDIETNDDMLTQQTTDDEEEFRRLVSRYTYNAHNSNLSQYKGYGENALFKEEMDDSSLHLEPYEDMEGINEWMPESLEERYLIRHCDEREEQHLSRSELQYEMMKYKTYLTMPTLGGTRQPLLVLNRYRDEVSRFEDAWIKEAQIIKFGVMEEPGDIVLSHQQRTWTNNKLRQYRQKKTTNRTEIRRQLLKRIYWVAKWYQMIWGARKAWATKMDRIKSQNKGTKMEAKGITPPGMRILLLQLEAMELTLVQHATEIGAALNVQVPARNGGKLENCKFVLLNCPIAKDRSYTIGTGENLKQKEVNKWIQKGNENAQLMLDLIESMRTFSSDEEDDSSSNNSNQEDKEGQTEEQEQQLICPDAPKAQRFKKRINENEENERPLKKRILVSYTDDEDSKDPTDTHMDSTDGQMNEQKEQTDEQKQKPKLTRQNAIRLPEEKTDEIDGFLTIINARNSVIKADTHTIRQTHGQTLEDLPCPSTLPSTTGELMAE